MEVISGTALVIILLIAYLERDRIRRVKLGSIFQIEFDKDLHGKNSENQKKADVATIDFPPSRPKAEPSRQSSKKDTLPPK